MVSLRWLFGCQLLCATVSAEAKCDNPLVSVIDAFFNVSNPLGLTQAMLGQVQAECAAGDCPTVQLGSGCSNVSVDALDCTIPDVFETMEHLSGGDKMCGATCGGINKAVCHGTELAACKAGCFGIFYKKCHHKCEDKLIKPCEKRLVDDCKKKCESRLDVDVTADFVRLDNAVSSMSVPDTGEIQCSGNGLLEPLRFSSTVAVELTDATVALRLHTKEHLVEAARHKEDTVDITLNNVRMRLAVPISGSAHCGFFSQSVEVTTGKSSVTNFDLDVHLDLDKRLEALSMPICLAYLGADPSCAGNVKSTLAKAIKDAILANVPAQAAAYVDTALAGLVKKAHCPSMDLLGSYMPKWSWG